MKNPFIDFISKNRKFLLCNGIAFLAILSITSIMFMIWAILLSPEHPIFEDIAGNEAKLEVIKLIGWGMSGIAVVWSIFGLLHRAAALDKQNAISEKGQVQERFKAAIGHLDSERILVRIASFYEFYRLAKIESEPDLKKNIFDILCAHLRQTTKYKDYKPEERVLEDGSKEIKPTEEVQSLLNILFKPDNKDNFIFAGLVTNLEEVYLPGANLQGADLQNAYLYRADLQNAFLYRAHLQKAVLCLTDLRNTTMDEANLQGADLTAAKLQGANLKRADLQEAYLYDAHLQGADLIAAKLRGACLHNTEINIDTTRMPRDWEKVVEKGGIGETGVIFVKD